MSESKGGMFGDIARLGGIQLNKVEHSSDAADMVLLREARRQGIRLPTAGDTVRDLFWGAYVATPRAGVNRNVGYLDLASLYPNLIRTLNASPETIVGTQDELDASEWSEDDCVWGYIDDREIKVVDADDPTEAWKDYRDPSQYKMVVEEDSDGSREKKWEDPDGPRRTRCYFLSPSVKEGFVPSVVDEWISKKDEYDGDMYAAVKVYVNSFYGYMGWTNSRLFDWRIAEAVTLAGRSVIQQSAQKSLDYIEDHTDAEPSNLYVSMGDTDGAGVTWDTAPSWEDAIDVMVDSMDYLNDEVYDEYMSERFGVDEHYMDIELESFASAVFVPADDPYDPDCTVGAKKRYAQRIVYDEPSGNEEPDHRGLVHQNDPETSITGMESVRSDTAPLTGELQTDVLTRLLEDGKDGREYVAERVREAYADAKHGNIDIDRLAKRKGIGQPLDEYGTSNRTPSPVYRGAKYATEHVDGTHLSAGDKGIVVYVTEVPSRLPRTYTAETAEDGRVVDAITVEDTSELPSDIRIDWAKHANKAVKDPLEPIVQTMGWSWSEIVNRQRQTGLGSF